eukprot:4279093-Pyramimonas_sp.AAC.1
MPGDPYCPGLALCHAPSDGHGHQQHGYQRPQFDHHQQQGSRQHYYQAYPQGGRAPLALTDAAASQAVAPFTIGPAVAPGGPAGRMAREREMRATWEDEG